MADEYKIRIVCNNPGCGETFFLVDETRDVEYSFPVPKAAFDFRERLENTPLGRDDVPEFYECPHCNSMPYRTEVQHLVVRQPEAREPIDTRGF